MEAAFNVKFSLFMIVPGFQAFMKRSLLQLLVFLKAFFCIKHESQEAQIKRLVVAFMKKKKSTTLYLEMPLDSE